MIVGANSRLDKRAAIRKRFLHFIRFLPRKCRANCPVCLASSKDVFEQSRANCPVCPALAPQFSFFQSVATRHECSSKKVRSPAFKRKGLAADTFRLKAGLRAFHKT